MFVTAQGSAFTRVRRALDHGNLVEALASASEMEHVGLVEALELCLLLAEKEPVKYERAALRWHARYCAEARDVVGTDEAQAVLSLLALLPRERGAVSAARDWESPLELESRQVSPSSGKVMTGLQARTMIGAIAHGVGVVTYGSRPLSKDGVDMIKLETVARDWLGTVFEQLSPGMFSDKKNVLRSAPVIASVAALGKAFYSGDAMAQRHSLEIVSDDSIDWMVGEHWSGLCGKVNPTTGSFAVGGSKEYAYATFKALNEPESEGGVRIRQRTEDAAEAA